jgi:hypothetical protein
MPIKRIIIQPKLSQEEAEREFKGKYLDRSHYDLLVSENMMGVLPGGEPKFVFLRGVIKPKDVEEFWLQLKTIKFKQATHSRRPALRGGTGGEIALGWFNKPVPRRLAPTDEYVDQYIGLLSLVAYFKGAIQKYLPEYWEQQVEVAKGNGHMRLWADLYEPGPALDKMLETIHNDNPELRATLSPIFSTLTINKSAIFRSHADAKNEGGLACLAAFGRFIGGDLCLPRLRVAFNLKPGDILICDNNREQHGNIGPLTGTRISVVCYLRAMETAKTTEA